MIGCSPKRKFNSEKWKKDFHGFEKDRYLMVDDLIKSQILIDKTKKQVIELLGEDYSDSSEWSISYPVYEYYGFDIDPTYGTNLNVFFKDDYCHYAEHKVIFDRR